MRLAQASNSLDMAAWHGEPDTVFKYRLYINLCKMEFVKAAHVCHIGFQLRCAYVCTDQNRRQRWSTGDVLQ